MKLETAQFGTIEFKDEILIRIEEGILGFEEYKEFILIAEDNSMIYWLNSIEEAELVFPLIPISVIDDNYPSVENHDAFAIVKMDKEPSNITINLKAPVYLDQNNKKGYQKIIDNDKFKIDYKLFIEN